MNECVGRPGDEVPTPVTPQIDMILLIDREVDMVTPLCTQLTYEGLIDEIIGVHNGRGRSILPLLTPRCSQASKSTVSSPATLSAYV